MSGRLAALGAAILAVGLAGCVGDTGSGAGNGPLTVYLSAPLSGKRAAEGQKIAAGAKSTLAQAGGRAGDRGIELAVLDDTGGGAQWSPVATAANARTATEDADTIAFIGDLDPAATGTSLPITDLARIPQVVLDGVPPGIDVNNLVRLDPAKAPEPGAAAMSLVLKAIARAGDQGTDREAVRDQMRTVAAGP